MEPSNWVRRYNYFSLNFIDIYAGWKRHSTRDEWDMEGYLFLLGILIQYVANRVKLCKLIFLEQLYI